jgi:hypothetical protein
MAPRGSGYTTPEGYVRLYVNDGKRRPFRHVHVWETVNGPVPNGMLIHHINGVKGDDRLENLQCVTRTEHMRIHRGFELRGGVWFKRCKECSQFLEVNTDNWHFMKNGRLHYGRCRPCHRRVSAEEKRARRTGRDEGE